MLRELVTTVLDALGLLVCAAGAGLLVAGLAGAGTLPAGAGVLTTGVVLVAGSVVMARMG
jgi:hypothetical protein